MLGFLAGVPGKLKTLTDRLSATWAAKLDTLHDARLTATRAGYIDRLDAAISTRATPAQVASAQLSGVIKSIQTGSITLTGVTTAVATITSVNTSKAVVLCNGVYGDETALNKAAVAVWLSSATQVTATRSAGTGGVLMVARYTVVEFY
jgi:hypothetical protein